jgi:hypothetical protein
MPEQFISSRFLLWEYPMASPGYDLIHRDTRGPVFDLGVVMDSYDGSVYLHQDDVIEMARTLGMATAEEVNNMQEVIEKLREQVSRLPRAEEALRNGLDNAVSKFYSDLSSDNNDDADNVSGSEPFDSPANIGEPEAVRAFKR